MTDILTPEARSERMSKIRQRDTKPELVLRKVLHAAGLRYVLHSKNLPGRPDIAFPRHHTALFVHGCFWHGHGCKAGRPPTSNETYWAAKIQGNRDRDDRKSAELLAQGWKVLVAWECETKGGRLGPLAQGLIRAIRNTDLA